ncbi:MAG: hypothetical protein GY882_01990 [Actinomycetia bacterium]|nr:hypothetical protein [Actinomycetes bacterium]MCP4845246.1 hypothetical protein [Actinomycetes bacterium]
MRNRLEITPEPSRELLGGPVDAYRNLNRGPGRVWSVRCRRSGLVVAWCRRVALAEATCVVSQAGRVRAHADGRRNVHAYVRGTLIPHPDSDSGLLASYDPFGGDGRFELVDGTPLATAGVVLLGPDGMAVTDPGWESD